MRRRVSRSCVRPTPSTLSAGVAVHEQEHRFPLELSLESSCDPTHSGVGRDGTILRLRIILVVITPSTSTSKAYLRERFHRRPLVGCGDDLCCADGSCYLYGLGHEYHFCLLCVVFPCIRSGQVLESFPVVSNKWLGTWLIQTVPMCEHEHILIQALFDRFPDFVCF